MQEMSLIIQLLKGPFFPIVFKSECVIHPFFWFTVAGFSNSALSNMYWQIVRWKYPTFVTAPFKKSVTGE